MPYHVGNQGSSGCSGYPVVSDTGKVMGCHPTKANAQEQVAALYAAGAADKSDCCPDDITKQGPCWDGYVQRGMKPGKDGKPVPNCVPVEKSETPMDVANNPIATDPTPASPSSHINPNAGMRRAQYMLNQPRPKSGGKIHNKPGVEIWAGSPFGKFDNSGQEIGSYTPPNPNPIDTYEGCDCPECMSKNIACKDCAMCANKLADSIFNLGSVASLITKQTIRWDKNA